jgi:hypothetical protein
MEMPQTHKLGSQKSVPVFRSLRGVAIEKTRKTVIFTCFESYLVGFPPFKKIRTWQECVS